MCLLDEERKLEEELGKLDLCTYGSSAGAYLCTAPSEGKSGPRSNSILSIIVQLVWLGSSGLWHQRQIGLHWTFWESFEEPGEPFGVLREYPEDGRGCRRDADTTDGQPSIDCWLQIFKENSVIDLDIVRLRSFLSLLKASMSVEEPSALSTWKAASTVGRTT